MILPDLKEVQVFSNFLYYIHSFFREKDFINIETPLLNNFATNEPYIDSLKTNNKQYLITSPEFNLKTLLSYYQKNLYQIAHVFRKGDVSKHHRMEFLMLEWYHLNINEFQLMNEIKELLIFLSSNISELDKINDFKEVSMESLFLKYCNSDFSRESLIQLIKEHHLVEKNKMDLLTEESYDELFFIVFLTLIEPKLDTTNPLFIYGYPAQLRAYSQIDINNPKVSRRFELYWKDLEIGNGYYEITNREEQWNQIQKEMIRRKELRKPILPTSNMFLNSFPLPECSGVSLGLERLYMAFRNLKDISKISFSGVIN